MDISYKPPQNKWFTIYRTKYIQENNYRYKHYILKCIWNELMTDAGHMLPRLTNYKVILQTFTNWIKFQLMVIILYAYNIPAWLPLTTPFYSCVHFLTMRSFSFVNFISLHIPIS